VWAGLSIADINVNARSMWLTAVADITWAFDDASTWTELESAGNGGMKR
jgi:hypothetical protein